MGNMTTFTAQMSSTFAKRMVMASIESMKGSMKVEAERLRQQYLTSRANCRRNRFSAKEGIKPEELLEHAMH